MRLIALNCPVCGGETELNYNIKSGFCKNCGSKVMLDEEIQKIRIDHYITVQNLIILAERAHTKEESHNLYLKALELDPNNFKTILGLMNSSLTPEKSSYYLNLYFTLSRKEGKKEKDLLEEISKFSTSYPEAFSSSIIKLNPTNKEFLNAAISSLFFNLSEHKTKNEIILNAMTRWKFYRVPPENILEKFFELLKEYKITPAEEYFRLLNIEARIIPETTLNKFFEIILNMNESNKKSYADFLFSFIAKKNKEGKYFPFVHSKYFPKDKSYFKLSLNSLKNSSSFFVASSLFLKLSQNDLARKSYLKTIFNILEKNIYVKNNLFKTRGLELFEFLSQNNIVLDNNSFPENYEFLKSFIPTNIYSDEKELLVNLFPNYNFSKKDKKKISFFNFLRRDK